VNQVVQQFSYVKNYSFIRSSDAHYINDIGSGYTQFYLKERSFEEIRMALHQEDGRYCEIPV
jgi:hypothetical protein